MNASEMARALLPGGRSHRCAQPVASPRRAAEVIKGAKQFNVIAAGRRWGKNTLAEGQIILPALQGKPVAWFSPTYKTLAGAGLRRSSGPSCGTSPSKSRGWSL